MAESDSIIIKMYDILLYAMPIINKFPRDYKFVLGDRIQQTLISTFEALLEAYYSVRSEKKSILSKVNVSLEKLRYLARLCYDLKLISNDRYQYLVERYNEVGKMVGGWIKVLS